MTITVSISRRLTLAAVALSLLTTSLAVGAVSGDGGPSDSCPFWTHVAGGQGLVSVGIHQDSAVVTLEPWDSINQTGCPLAFESAVATLNAHIPSLWVQGVAITNNQKTLTVYLNRPAPQAVNVAITTIVHGE